MNDPTDEKSVSILGPVEYWIVLNETNTDVRIYTRRIYSGRRIPVVVQIGTDLHWKLHWYLYNHLNRHETCEKYS